MNTMRSAVFDGDGRIHVERMPRPQPSNREVRVRLHGCGVCASNLPVWAGRPWFRYPFEPGAPGHEGWGEIDEVGDGVDGWHAGDRVALSFPAAVGFISQPKGTFTLALDGKALLEFDVVVDDAHFVGPEGATLDFSCRQANSEDATGIMTLTVPARLVKAGRAAELQVVGSAAGSQRWFGVLVCPEE